MSNKITLELSPNQIEKLVERLPIQEKIKLAAQLDKQTWNIRFGNLVRKLRQRAKESSISEKKIGRACQRARRRLYYGEN